MNSIGKCEPKRRQRWYALVSILTLLTLVTNEGVRAGESWWNNSELFQGLQGVAIEATLSGVHIATWAEHDRHRAALVKYDGDLSAATELWNSDNAVGAGSPYQERRLSSRANSVSFMSMYGIVMYEDDRLDLFDSCVDPVHSMIASTPSEFDGSIVVRYTKVKDVPAAVAENWMASGCFELFAEAMATENGLPTCLAQSRNGEVVVALETPEEGAGISIVSSDLGLVKLFGQQAPVHAKPLQIVVDDTMMVILVDDAQHGLQLIAASRTGEVVSKTSLDVGHDETIANRLTSSHCAVATRTHAYVFDIEGRKLYSVSTDRIQTVAEIDHSLSIIDLSYYGGAIYVLTFDGVFKSDGVTSVDEHVVTVGVQPTDTRKLAVRRGQWVRLRGLDLVEASRIKLVDVTGRRLNAHVTPMEDGFVMDTSQLHSGLWAAETHGGARLIIQVFEGW